MYPLQVILVPLLPTTKGVSLLQIQILFGLKTTQQTNLEQIKYSLNFGQIYRMPLLTLPLEQILRDQVGTLEVGQLFTELLQL